MTLNRPKVDGRTAADVSARVVTLLERYTTSPGAPATPYTFLPWRDYDPATRAPLGPSAALVGVFARFAEIVIERLNEVPDKNFRAFLGLLGATQLPPQPARVPLTFSLAAGRTDDAIVPAGTRVAAQPAQGDAGPIVFEVEQPLVVIAAELVSLVTFDPETDTYTDSSGRAPATSPPFLVFEGDHAAEHVLYLGDDRLLGYGKIRSLRVAVQLSPSSAVDPRAVRWERWDGTAWVALTPASDGTQSLTSSGTLGFGAIPPAGVSTVGARTSRWIRGRLLTPISPSAEPRAGMVRAAQLPTMATVELAVDVERAPAEGLTPEMGFTLGAPIDLTKEFYPFGEKPKLYDTLYLASHEGFSKDPTSIGAGAGAEVQLEVDIANAHNSGLANSVVPSNLELVWECGTGNGWTEVGRSNGPPTVGTPAPAPAPNSAGFADGTFGLCQSGTVRLRLPDTVAPAVVNGQSNSWLRVRIVRGDYGREASYVADSGSAAGFRLIPASFRPPVIARIRIGYRFTARRPPASCITYNGLQFDEVSSGGATPAAPFAPFALGVDQPRPGLSLGFTLPPRRTAFPNTTLSLYASPAPAKYGGRPVPLGPDVTTSAGVAGTEVTHTFVITNPSANTETFTIAALGHQWSSAAPDVVDVDAGQTQDVIVTVTIPPDAQPGDSDRGFLRVRAASDPDVVFQACFVTAAGVQPSPATPRLLWQYWSGSSWVKLAVRDGSAGFTKPGLVELVAPRDFVPRTLFGRERYWLRVLWEQGDYPVWPRLRDVLINTTTAVQTSTLVNEILGSSNGTKGQTFVSSRAPVLDGLRVEVREPEMPSVDELEALRDEEGDDAVHVVSDATGRRREIWVRWHEVPDFYGSGPHDRHYVMDHFTGSITFGDGVSGRVPPIGPSNVRLARYQSGGGVAGNRRAGTVTQLKTTVPYVEKVTNLDEATGGADAEPIEALYERVPRALRHRDRTVTREDYEDLAALASPEVARSFCVPVRDLAADPLGAMPRYGMVSVIVVPRSAEPKPQPTLELLARVRRFLSDRAPAGAALSVVGPLYVRVDIRVEIAVAAVDDVGAIERAVRQRLADFLHPLTGGLDQRGWDFGRAPHRSDVLSLIEGVPGVDHIRYLQFDEIEDLPGVKETMRFLVYSGQHQVDLVFEET